MMQLYGCNYPKCRHTFSSLASVRKHAKKQHIVWIQGKVPSTYCVLISDGAEIINDFKIMIPILLTENDINFYLKEQTV